MFTKSNKVPLGGGDGVVTAAGNLALMLISALLGFELLCRSQAWAIFFFLFALCNLLATFAHGVEKTLFWHKLVWVLISFFSIAMLLVFSFLILKNSLSAEPIKLLLAFSLSYLIVGGIIFRKSRDAWNFTVGYIIFIGLLNISSLVFSCFYQLKIKFLLLLIGVLMAVAGLLFQIWLKKRTKRIYIFNYNDIYHIFLLFAVFIIYFGALRN